ncbi:MAG: D-sedoheptulose 7-phosphate isomerase [Candidatus Liptonbacteria bacterium]|nr:D-sedoheptulose 7-phosphate isomerase [Candidatus Liptonbacteria bacterium]
MSIISEAFERHKDLVLKLNSIVPDIEKGAELLADVVKRGNKLLACGNGGSAADAQHLVAEWMCKYKDDRKPLPAISLTTNTSTITAIANDYGFEYVFSRQVESLGQSGDALVAITTSGKSPNILKAIDVAKNKGMKVIVLAGERGADLKKIVDLAVVVPSSETARIQEMHELIIHAWCEFVDESIKNS